MKRGPAAEPAELVVTSVKLDQDLAERAHTLARRNKRRHFPHDRLYKILNAALEEYLKKNS